MAKLPDNSSLHLCAGTRENQIAHFVLERCITAIGRYATDHAVRALLLTGSFSRGEGSILASPSGSSEMLGDMEFFAVLTDNADFTKAHAELDVLSRSVEAALYGQGIVCTVEFSPVDRNYFRRIRPSIFNYELLRNGKVVFGDEAILSEAPLLSPDNIPSVDGFYLLGNRLVEQLIALQLATAGNTSPAYQILKLYLDMAGSYLTVSGRYVPTYAERVDACERWMQEDNFFSSQRQRENFIATIKEATAHKLNPGGSECSLMSGEDSATEYFRLYREAMSFCGEIWQWELKQLFNVSAAPIIWRGSTGNYLPLRVILREWLKFVFMAYRGKQDISHCKSARLFFQRTPRTLIYAAAFQLCCAIAENSAVDCSEIAALLPVPNRFSTSDEAMGMVIDLWNRFVRSA